MAIDGIGYLMLSRIPSAYVHPLQLDMVPLGQLFTSSKIVNSLTNISRRILTSTSYHGFLIIIMSHFLAEDAIPI